MKHRLNSLLLGVFGCILAGYIASPLMNFCMRSNTQPVKPADAGDAVAVTGPAKPVDADPSDGVKVVVIDESGAVSYDDQPDSDDIDPADDGDDAWSLDDGGYITESDPNTYMREDAPEELAPMQEEDVEVPAAFTGVPHASAVGRLRSAEKTGERLASKFARQESSNKKQKYSTGYRNENIDRAEWNNPDQLYKKLCEKVLTKLGKCDDVAVSRFLEEPENRLDLARVTLMRKVGMAGMREVAQMKMGATFLHAFTSDLDWMTGVLFSGPTGREAQGLKYMASLYAQYPEEMAHPVVRRIAGTTAMEFAREGWSEKHMAERFKYYFTSYKQGRLNVIFDDLQYWESRLVCGCTEPEGWGSPVSMAWQRDNVRLPAAGYLDACCQLQYRLRNVAGDSVFSGEYLAPVLKYMNYAKAWAHREIGGVCGACSHYGAYGALASGIPAMTMGEPGHCAYVVRVGNDWKKSYSIYWQHGMHKTFWGMHDWDFLILMQDLYADRYRTQASDFWLAVADLFAARKMEKPAMLAYEGATAAQPLNWPAWISYASYVKQKAPKDATHWRSMNDRIVDTMNTKFHNASATFLSNYVYPNLLPLMPDKGDRNKMFAAFFKKCDNFGTNRWDITKFLNVQMSGCTNSKEQLAYMKDALKILMSKPDYSGSVLAWGLDFTAKLAPKDGKASDAATKLQEEFSDLIIKALARSGGGKKQADQTWNSLGEAINAATGNGDVRTFQAIGRLAARKCKKKFPKNRFKFRPIGGKVVSTKGMITTSATLTEKQVANSCLHWGVLQRTGGSIPVKLAGNKGAFMKVSLDDTYNVTGAVILFNVKVKKDRPFHLEVSDDGQNWTELPAKIEVSGAIIRVEARKSTLTARHVRLLRDGDKYEDVNIVGFYVYGKPVRTAKKS